MAKQTTGRILSLLILTALLANTFIPGLHPLQITFAEGPPPPATPPLTPPPAGSPPPTVTPPVPGDLPPGIEAGRARQAMAGVLEKYLRHWGMSDQLTALTVTVQDRWAYGLVQLPDNAGPFEGTLHILARQGSDGTWHAFLPGSDDAYQQWLDAVPESLMSPEVKAQVQVQSETVGKLEQPQVIKLVPEFTPTTKLLNIPLPGMQNIPPLNPTPQTMLLDDDDLL